MGPLRKGKEDETRGREQMDGRTKLPYPYPAYTASLIRMAFFPASPTHFINVYPFPCLLYPAIFPIGVNE